MARTKAQERAAAVKAHEEAGEKERDAGYPSLDDAVEVEFAHPETGVNYGSSIKAYRDIYAGLGYEILRRGDGVPLPYSQPLAVEPEDDEAAEDAPVVAVSDAAPDTQE